MVLVLELKPNTITGFVLGINLIVVLFPELKFMSLKVSYINSYSSE